MWIYKIFIFILCTNAYALECPNFHAPKCPTSGIKVLDDTFPTQSFVITGAQTLGSMKQYDKVPSDFALKIIESYDATNIPQIIIVTDKLADFEKVKATVKQSLEKEQRPPQEIEKILGQLTHANAQAYTFIQDPFISMYNETTGSPQISLFDSFSQDENHKNVKSSLITSEIYNSISKCNGELLTPLPKDPASFRDGEMGGNIQGVPGGLCMIGNNLGDTNANKICGGTNNIIKIHTTWLNVGHVDEILKIIPTNKNDGRPKECQFAILNASPKKALEILSQPTNLKRKFFSFSKALDEKQLLIEKAFKCSNSGRWIQYTENVFTKKNKEIIIKENDNNSKAKSVLYNILFPPVFADDNSDGGYKCEENESTGCYRSDNLQIAFSKKCLSSIETLTNEDFLNEYQNDEKTVKLNKAVDEAIDQDVRELKNKILNRLPQCKKYLQNIDVPNLFYDYFDDTSVEEKNGQLKLKENGSAVSFTPNPTNSVIANNTILFSDTASDIFNTYLENESSRIGLKGKTIDTWDFAHIGGGELHCASHSINYCSPNVKK